MATTRALLATSATGALLWPTAATFRAQNGLVAPTFTNVIVSGTLATTGVATFTGNIAAQSGTFATTLAVTGASTFTGTIGAQAITAATTLAVAGASTFTGALGAQAGTFGTTLTVTGAFTASSTANVVGNFAVNTTKFNVEAATGNTEIDGDLAVDGSGTIIGDFFCNAMFAYGAAEFSTTLTVASTTTLAALLATTGSFSSTLAVTGVATFATTVQNVGITILQGGVIGGVQGLTGAGAVNLTTVCTDITSTGANALTLANGTNGQIKILTMIVDGGDATLTPTTKTGFTTITFNDVGDSCMLQYHTTFGWMLVGTPSATAA